MKIVVETERLILREFLLTDAEAFFEMDSNPEVHRYLGNKPIRTIDEAITVIKNIRQQYIANGIGRWAAIEKLSGEFIGWSGLYFHPFADHGINSAHFWQPNLVRKSSY